MESRPWLCFNAVKKIVCPVHGVCVSVQVGGNLETLPSLVEASISGREQYSDQRRKAAISTSMLRVHINREADVRVIGFLDTWSYPGTDIQSKLAKQLANK